MPALHWVHYRLRIKILSAYLPHAEADTVLALLLTLGRLKLLAGERLLTLSLIQVLASGLVRSAYTPGTARPQSRPQLTTPTWTILSEQPLVSNTFRATTETC